MKTLSFVIPCYRSEKTIEKVIREINETMREHPGYGYEIICVNDASPDGVYEVLKKAASEDRRVKVINFAKNMGKHAAVLAGYSVVSGDYVVNLDDDCQCPVYDVFRLIRPLEADECDIATAEYDEKKESSVKRIGSDLNMKMSEVLLDKPRGLRLENFSAVKRFVTDEIIRYKNPYPYLEGLILRVTKRISAVPMHERGRGDDKSSGFTFGKSLALAVNGMTAFSVKPLRVASLCGVLFAVVGICYGIYTVIHKIIHPEVLLGYSSLLSVLLFSSGLIMLMLGMIGEYLGRIYICINDSPQYVIKDTINI